MRFQKRYNPHTGVYEDFDPLTGAGIFDFFGKIGSQMASDTAKKMAQKAAEEALAAGMKKAGEKAGEYVVDKVFSKPQKPTQMGQQLVDELKKENSKKEKEYKDLNQGWDPMFFGSSMSRNARIKNIINRKKKIFYNNIE